MDRINIRDLEIKIDQYNRENENETDAENLY